MEKCVTSDGVPEGMLEWLTGVMEDNPEWAAANAAIDKEVNAMKRARRIRRSVQWADRMAIATFYAEAARLTRQTGIPHEVDHIIPLQGRRVSGLHVESNLRVIPYKENRSKLNHFGECE